MLSLARRLINVSAVRASSVRLTALRAAAFSTEAEQPAQPNAEEPQREVGTVKWFSKEKGFGFISRADGTDVFVHFTNLRGSGFRTLEEGQAVDFVVAPGKKGQEARDVGAR